jgi:hypothetical protein
MMWADAGEFILLGAAALMGLGLLIAGLAVWDFKKQRREDDAARLHRRLGHVSEHPL